MLFVLLLSGCAATPQYIKGYSGNALPASEVALIKPVAFLVIYRIDSLDGLKINPSGPGLSTTEYEIELPAGEHDLEVSFDNGTRHSIDKLWMKALVKRARRYIIQPVWKDRRWKPVLIDVTDKPECWTLAVGVMTGPKGCE